MNRGAGLLRTSLPFAALVTAAFARGSEVPPRSSAPFDLQGHRGARGLAPENTLAAFARALSEGVSTLELDLAVTHDGVVIVSHERAPNPDVTRAPDGRWLETPGRPFFTLTFEETRRFDVGRIRPGSAYAAQFPEQVPSDGTRIPTLREVYDLARRAHNDRVRFNIETKIDPAKAEETLAPEPFVDAVLAVVREANAESRTSLESFDWRSLRYAQRVAPAVQTVYLTVQQGDDTVQAGRSGASPWLAGFDVDDYGGSVPRLVAAAGGRIWSPLFRDLSADGLAEAHRLGLRVIAWTVNRPEDMASLIDRGVDGLITDRPDVARRVMAQKGLALPAPTPVVP